MGKLRESARGRDCALQLHPFCNLNPDTTVLAHINSPAKGWALKSPDFFGVFACSDCHDILDKRKFVDIEPIEIERAVIRALYKTWKIWTDEGFIKL